MRRLPVLLAVLALGAAACGDDDVESVATEGPAVTDVSPATDPPATDPPATDPPATDPPATDDGASSGAADDGPIPTGDAGSPWCTAAAEVEARFDELDMIDFSDAEMVEASYRIAVEEINAAQQVVPPELAVALDTTIVGLDLLVIEFDRVDWDFADVDLSVLDEAGMEAAGNEIDRYNFYVCGIDNGYDPDSASTDDEPTVDSSGTIREDFVEQLTGAGFTTAEADCIADNYDFSGTFDEASMRALFTECDIPLERLALLFGE